MLEFTNHLGMRVAVNPDRVDLIELRTRGCRIKCRHHEIDVVEDYDAVLQAFTIRMLDQMGK